MLYICMIGYMPFILPPIKHEIKDIYPWYVLNNSVSSSSPCFFVKASLNKLDFILNYTLILEINAVIRVNFCEVLYFTEIYVSEIKHPRSETVLLEIWWVSALLNHLVLKLSEEKANIKPLDRIIGKNWISLIFLRLIFSLVVTYHVCQYL